MKKNREWLVKYRGDMTQKEVAEKSQIKRAYYTQIENGSRNPSVKIAKKIAEVLGCDWTKFFEDESNNSLQKQAI